MAICKKKKGGGGWGLPPMLACMATVILQIVYKHAMETFIFRILEASCVSFSGADT